MAFADRLKEFREKKVKSSRLCKNDRNKYKNSCTLWRRRKIPKRCRGLQKIAEVMDCDYNYLLEESDEFLNRVYNMGGKRELEKARALTEGLSSLFAGGEISDEDKDAAFEAITRAYWEAKRENKKYGRKKKD